MCGNVDHKPFIKEGYESEGNPLRRHVKINMTLLMRRMRDAPPGKVSERHPYKLFLVFNLILVSNLGADTRHCNVQYRTTAHVFLFVVFYWI